MEGEQFESTNVESQSVETSSYSQEGSDSTYESSEGSSSSSSDVGYEEGSSSYDGGSEGSKGEVISARSDEGTSFELYTDPTTGKTEFRVRSPKENKEEEYEEEGDSRDSDYSEEEGETQEGLTDQYREQVNNNYQQLPKYTLDEFSYALANGVVDASRVPEEYQAQYADYKINLAKNEYNNKVASENQRRNMLAQQMQAQSTPEARIAANETFFENLEYEAINLAMHDLGITKEKLENSEFDEDEGAALKSKLETAKNWHKQRLMNELQSRYNQEQAYKSQQQQLYSEITDFTRYVQSTEPHFNEIDKMLAVAWQEMPTKYGTVVKSALDNLAQGTITRQQVQVIQKYYEDTRKLYYARQNGLNAPMLPQQKKRPPAVEKAGNGQASISSKSPDYSALRNADARGKKAWLGEFFKGIEL